jgi:hypothetical protein
VNVRLSVAVMAHPARTQQAWWLARELDAPIIWDRGAGEWDTGARAWAAFTDTATHHLVIQDDAIPMPRLIEHAASAIAARPSSPISFYLGRSRPPGMQRRIMRATLGADESKAAWLHVNDMLHGVAIALPVVDIAPMLEWAQTSHRPYDDRIGTWYRRQGADVEYTWPSLVDHADLPTLVDHADGDDRPVGRVAWRVGKPKSWHTPSVRI